MLNQHQPPHFTESKSSDFNACAQMNFINDLITDEDRKRFDFSVFKRAPDFVYKLSEPTIWTVDREAGVFLIWLGNQGPQADDEDRRKGVTYYSLWWNECNIECKLWRFDHAQNSITWKQDWISIPEKYLDRKQEVWGVLQEALIAYQLNGNSSFLFFGDPPVPELSEIKFDF